MLAKFCWFIEWQNLEIVSFVELRRFFAYLTVGHTYSQGRWHNPRCIKPLRPTTVQNYHKHLKAFFEWLVEEGYVATSAMQKVDFVVARVNQIQPFTHEQIEGLLRAAQKSRHRRRDEALVYFLLDMGLRASELCSLRIKDIDLQEKRCRCLGKGNKYRTVPFGMAVKKTRAILKRLCSSLTEA